jgi:cytochrome c oxidase cbb3-type subunit IV
MHSLITDFITTFWTPLFFAIFLGILAYALWPANRETFEDAARMPLRED